MTDRFGMNHRQQVRDVNAGKITPDVPDAVKGRRSGAQSRAADRVVGVNLGPTGNQLIANALLRGAGVVGEKVSRENQRKAKVEGQILAGTEEGRAIVAEKKDTLATKIFGPDATVRAAEERIVKDEVDNVHLKLGMDLEEFGHKMDEGEWKQHSTAKLEEMLDKYDDEDLKDQIAARYGANAAALAKDYTLKREVYTQELERTTYAKSLAKGAEMAQVDLDSGNPERLDEAQARYASALTKPEGMSDEAYKQTTSNVIKNELVEMRPGMYEFAKENGILDDLDYEDGIELQQAHDIYKAKADTDGMIAVQQLSELAQKGEIETVRTQGAALMKQYPYLFKTGLSPFIKTAWDAKTDIEAENRKKTVHKAYAATASDRLHTDLTPAERKEAVEADVTDRAKLRLREKHKAEAQRNGEEYDAHAPITDIQIQDELIRSIDQWGPRYFHSATKVPVVERAIERVAFDLRNPDITTDQLKGVEGNVRQMMKLRDMDPFGFSEHLTVADATRMTAVAGMLDSGKTMEQIWPVLHPKKEVKLRTLTKTEKEQVTSISGKLASDFMANFKGDDVGGIDWISKDPMDEYSRKDLGIKLDLAVEEGMQIYGDSHMAEYHAKETVLRQAVRQGDKIVFDGAYLNTEHATWDRYLRGWEDDAEFQNMLRAKGVDPDVRLRDGRTVPDAGGGDGATIYMPNVHPDAMDIPIRVKLPTSIDQIRPTSGWGFGEVAEPIEGVDFDPSVNPNRWDEASDMSNNGAGPLSFFVSPAGAAEDTTAPSGDQFRSTLAAVENGVKAGFDPQTKRWTPHASPEGGTDTIAFGHKLTAEESRTGTVTIDGKKVDTTKGLTQEQAWKLLDQDIEKHTKQVRRSVREFDKLPEKYQQVLVNIAFNVGSVTERKWPKLLAAMRRNDDRAVRQEMVTSYTDKGGKRKQLKQRATDVANAVGLAG